MSNGSSAVLFSELSPAWSERSFKWDDDGSSCDGEGVVEPTADSLDGPFGVGLVELSDEGVVNVVQGFDEKR